MILPYWFRRIILVAFIVEVTGGILWVTGRLSTNPIVKPTAQALGSLIFLFGFYASTPLSACFLAPRPSWDVVLQERLVRIVATVPDSRPIFLYDYTDKEASTVGLLSSHSRICVTTDLLASMSDEDMWGMIAHENAHVHGHHIFATFIYVCYFVVSSRLLGNNSLFFAVFPLFPGIRRYYEYRTDVNAAQSVGREAMSTALHELAVLYPSKSWIRQLSFVNTYPTSAMWMRAVKTG